MNSLKLVRQAGTDTGDGVASLRRWDQRDDPRIYNALVGRVPFARYVRCVVCLYGLQIY